VGLWPFFFPSFAKQDFENLVLNYLFLRSRVVGPVAGAGPLFHSPLSAHLDEAYAGFSSFLDPLWLFLETDRSPPEVALVLFSSFSRFSVFFPEFH